MLHDVCLTCACTLREEKGGGGDQEEEEEAEWEQQTPAPLQLKASAQRPASGAREPAGADDSGGRSSRRCNMAAAQAGAAVAAQLRRQPGDACTSHRSKLHALSTSNIIRNAFWANPVRPSMNTGVPVSAGACSRSAVHARVSKAMRSLYGTSAGVPHTPGRRTCCCGMGEPSGSSLLPRSRALHVDRMAAGCSHRSAGPCRRHPCRRATAKPPRLPPLAGKRAAAALAVRRGGS